MSPVWDDMDPGGVVAGQRDGHGGHGVLHYGEQLDVAEMEVVLVTKPGRRRLCLPTIENIFSIKDSISVFRGICLENCSK